MSKGTKMPFSQKKYFSFLAIAIGVCFLSSCVPTKTSYYFKSLQKDTTLAVFVNKDGDLKIQKTDRLSIQISSLNSAEDALYNSTSGGGSSISSLTTSGPTAVSVAPVQGPVPGYPVDSLGNIQIHRLGDVHVEGLTLTELSDKLKKGLDGYLKEPIISVNFANHRVTMLGSVGSPRILDMPAGPLSIFDALALSGDASLDSYKKNILIVRDSLNNKKFKRINLEDGSVFNTQWYYLQPNDIVYVEPNIEKIEKEANRTNAQQTITIAASVLTIAIIVLDRVIK